MASITPIHLATAAIGTGAGTLIYTVPAATTTLLKDFNVANTTAGSITLTLYIVPSAGSPAADNTLIPTVAIAANTTLHWTGTIVIPTGSFIQAVASATGCTIIASGGAYA